MIGITLKIAIMSKEPPTSDIAGRIRDDPLRGLFSVDPGAILGILRPHLSWILEGPSCSVREGFNTFRRHLRAGATEG